MRKSITSILVMLLAPLITVRAQTDFNIPFPRPLHDTADTVTMVVIGDVMMHAAQLEYDCSSFLSGISSKLKGADIAVANAEFTNAGKPYSGYPCFSAPDAYSEYLAGCCGIDVFLTANNHILDKGRKGAVRTMAVYDHLTDSLGMQYTGISRSTAERRARNPLILRRHGRTIAIVNFTYGTNSALRDSTPIVEIMDRKTVRSAIERAKEENADFIIAMPHWGEEYQLRHSPDQEEWAEWLVSEGVDAIIGAHPHVVQDTTHIKGVPVIYSMGNAVSNMSATNTRLGLAVTLLFVSDRSTGEMKMLEPRLDFTWCSLPGNLTGNYMTIFIKEWTNRRDDWSNVSDYDNMSATLERVKRATGIVAE